MVLLLRVTQRLRAVCLVDLLKNLHDFKIKILSFSLPIFANTHSHYYDFIVVE